MHKPTVRIAAAALVAGAIAFAITAAPAANEASVTQVQETKQLQTDARADRCCASPLGDRVLGARLAELRAEV